MKTKLLIALALIGISMSSAIHAASYTDVFTLTGFSGSGINSSNHVVGDYNGRIGVFLANTNNPTEIDVSRDFYTGSIISTTSGIEADGPLRINDSGEISGTKYQVYDSEYDDYEEEWNHYDYLTAINTYAVNTNETTDIGYLSYESDDSIGGSAADINKSGKTAVSVGIYYEQDVYVCSFGGGSKQFMPLTKSGSDDNYRHPYGINDSNQVTGITAFFDGYNQYENRAFLWTAGNTSATELPTLTPGLGSADDYAAWGTDINNEGIVVGMSGLEYSDYYDTYVDDLEPFVWEPTTANGTTGTITELPSLSGNSATPYVVAINNNDIIVGYQGGKAVKWEKVSSTWTITDISTVTGHTNLEVIKPHDINDNDSIVASGKDNGSSVCLVLIP